MSFISTFVVCGGIIMAADRQETQMAYLVPFSTPDQKGTEKVLMNMLDDKIKNTIGTINQFCRPITKTARKLFTMGNNIGIATGQAMHTSKGLPVDVFIDYFCRTNNFDKPKEAAEKLCEYIRGIDGNMDAIIMLAGYDKSEPDLLSGETYHISIKNNEVKPMRNLGFNYAGANDYFLQYCEKLNSGENIFRYTLQDAVDISKFAIDTCRGLEKYLDCRQAISDNIEMIAITHRGIQWIKKMELTI